MKRIPFKSSDINKFKGIAKQLFRGLDLVAHQNPDRLRELVAKVAAYNDLYEVNACVGKQPFPPVGSITRADIQLAFAHGVCKITGMPLMEAWRRAERSRLRDLSIDGITVEAQLEIARGSNGDTTKQKQATGQSWHDEQLRLFKLGAPSFELTVRRDGRAFHWASFTALYDAIRASRFEHAIVDPLQQYPAGSEEVIDSFISKSLIPQSWIPLSQHIQYGLPAPDHEVTWLFVETGECIGRAIRHAAHGSFLPRLFLTDEEVAEGLSNVTRGIYIQPGSSRLSNFMSPPKGDDAVYTLKPGVRTPGASSDPLKQIFVGMDDLEVVPNLYAGSLNVYTGRGVQLPTVWALDGKAVRTENINTLTSTYFESIPWLTESDMPSIFPDQREEPQDDHRDRFAFFRDMPNKVFLPPKALDFHKRASNILERQGKTAYSRLSEAAESGEFASLCKLAFSSADLEQAARVFLVEQSPEVAVADLIKQAKRVSAQVVQRFPELAYYGHFTLYAAISVHCQGGPFADFYVDTLTFRDLLTGLAMLQAGCKVGVRFRFIRSAPSNVAVMQWLTGVIAFEDIYQVASCLEGYADTLKVQQERINRIKVALEHDKDRRSEASDHGYVYVGIEMLQAKPRSEMQMISFLSD